MRAGFSTIRTATELSGSRAASGMREVCYTTNCSRRTGRLQLLLKVLTWIKSQAIKKSGREGSASTSYTTTRSCTSRMRPSASCKSLAGAPFLINRILPTLSLLTTISLDLSKRSSRRNLWPTFARSRRRSPSFSITSLLNSWRKGRKTYLTSGGKSLPTMNILSQIDTYRK